MPLPGPREGRFVKRRDRTFVRLVIAFAVLMACGWAYYLPIFLNPDEDSHYDYALTVFSAGRPLKSTETVVGRDTHPVVEYLMRETHARQLRLDLGLNADPGYGSAAYFHNLDANAPKARFTGRIEPAPYISRLYPIGYFAIVAGAIALGDALFDHSVVAQFYSARLLSVVLLIPTLWFGWLTLLELPLAPKKAKAIFVCLALMPLTLWMASSIQPDVLVCALIAPITYVALRLRKTPSETKLLLVLGVLLAILMATKRHYFLALYVPIATMLAIRLPWRTAGTRALRSMAYASVPAGVALVLTERFLHTVKAITGVCQGPTSFSVAAAGGTGAIVQFFFLGLQRAIRTTFLDEAGLSFWFNYTAYRNTSIEIVSRQFTFFLTNLIPTLSVLVAILFIVRLQQVGRALISVGRRRSWRSAARIATSNVLLNSFVAFIVIVYGFEISIGGEIPMQGRYWLPFLPAIWLSTFYIAPRMLPHRLRAPAGNVAFAFVFTFGILASAYTFPSLHDRFYGPVKVQAPQRELTSALWADVSHGYVNVNGVAYDLRSASPVARVVLEVDRRRRFIATAFDRPDVQCDMEQTLLHVGFRARIPVRALGQGPHHVEVLVATSWQSDLIDTGKGARITIGDARQPTTVGLASHAFSR